MRRARKRGEAKKEDVQGVIFFDKAVEIQAIRIVMPLFFRRERDVYLQLTPCLRSLFKYSEKNVSCF